MLTVGLAVLFQEQLCPKLLLAAAIASTKKNNTCEPDKATVAT